MDESNKHQLEEEKTTIGSAISKIPTLNFDQITKKYFKFSRNLQSPGDLVDYIIDNIIPKVAKNQQDNFLKETQESIDYIFRHIL
ncbi:MAG: hypothetical protein ACTSYI_05085 [Promethearchaeota archaeon]